MKKAIIILSMCIVVIVTGCYYDKEDLLYGTDCDTSNVTYSSTIKGLLNNYACMSCHVGANPSGGINLETYTNVKGMADAGRLFGAINHSPGFRPMPDGAAKMNSCDIKKVKAWIEAGAPNN
jgi:hypothetical protein